MTMYMPVQLYTEYRAMYIDSTMATAVPVYNGFL
jgi:hypothetical protein